MKFGSVCSGIEAASVAWRDLGWRCAWLSEIDSFPSSVLSHRLPDVPNLGDMTRLPELVLNMEIEAPDVLVGGTPCQGFSVAGLRKSLSDDRSNLALQFIRIANAIDDIRRADGREPAYILWENVPGVLSTDDNAFGTFLAGLVGSDTPLVPPKGTGWTDAGVVDGPQRCAAWRCLDAQHFGLAQRRKRVFVLARGHPRGWTCADALLPVIESVRWHPPPRREKRERAASTLSARTRGGGGLGTDFDCDGGLIANSWPADVAPTLNAHFGDKQGLEDQHALAGAGLFVPHTAHPLRAEGFDASEDGTGRGTPIVPIQSVQSIRDKKENGIGIGEPGDEMFTLTGRDQHAVAYRTSCNCGAWETGDKVDALTTETDPNSHVLAFSSKDHGADVGDIAPTLRAMGHRGSHANAGGQLAVALRGREGGATAELCGEVMPALRTGAGGGDKAHALTGMQVRRLTPRECERLQGFPDDWTLVPYRGKPAADGPRYKAIGNSFAVPVVRWIGERIQMVEEALAK